MKIKFCCFLQLIITFCGEKILTAVFQSLLFIIVAIPVLIFGFYGLILAYYYKRIEETEKHSSTSSFQPLVSVLTPTHNEEMVIGKKIENILESNYPSAKLELIFIDDSNDSTPDIIEKYSKKYANVCLIRFNERMGYSPCMIAGFKKANGEIIVLNDAGSFLDKDAIPNLVAHFVNPKIGVVTGKDVLMNKDESGGKSENFYLKFLHFQRTAESKMDSTFFIKGEATAVKRNLITDLEICGETFDSTVGMFVRKKGYKVVYDPNVKFYEYAPSTNNDLIKQKTIRAANLIKVLWRFKELMFNPKLGKYGSVILPMNFAMLTVVPLSIISGLIVLAVLSLLDLFFGVVVWTIIGAVFLFLLLFRRNLVVTFVGLEFSLLKALYQIIFTKKTHDKIDKVASTRRV